jgi:hypothetical protein
MDRAALALLGPGVDVAQAALEWVLVEDRGGAGGVIDARDDVARPGRGVFRASSIKFLGAHPIMKCRSGSPAG